MARLSIIFVLGAAHVAVPAHLRTGVSVLDRDRERVASVPALAVSDMCESNVTGVVAESAKPVQLLMDNACAVVCRAVRTGVSLTVPSGYTIRKGSILVRGEHSR
jgi:hypothetical protein